MDFVIDFLVGNYMWFLVITIILIFALIGYIVDSREHKEVSIFDSPQELAKSLEMLAASAQNKTIGDAMQNPNQGFQVNVSPANTILPNSQVTMNPNHTSMNSISHVTMNPTNMNSNMQGVANSTNMINPVNQNITNSNSSFEILGK